MSRKHERPDRQELACCSMHDPTMRRGIWYTIGDDNKLVIYAGREGDDKSAMLEVGQPVTPGLIRDVRDCLSTGCWMRDEHGPKFSWEIDAPLMPWLRTRPATVFTVACSECEQHGPAAALASVALELVLADGWHFVDASSTVLCPTCRADKSKEASSG